MKIKLCGFNEENSLKAAIEANVDFIGFIFHKESPRNISLQKAQELSALIPSHIKKVSVTVNQPISKLEEISKAINPDFFQLHGEESGEEIEKIKEIFPKTRIIKAFNIKDESDFGKAIKFQEKYGNLVDFFLFDSKIAGSGQVFDWNLLKNFIKENNLKKEYFLSGGLNLDNIELAIKETNAKMIDISSGIEIEKGKKSPELIREFVKKAKSLAI